MRDLSPALPRFVAFVRPEPYPQPLLAALGNVVPTDTFIGQRVLALGGSRGLGELAAKLLATGGADVTITYREGQTGAAAIVAGATELSLKMQSLRFDSACQPTRLRP